MCDTSRVMGDEYTVIEGTVKFRDGKKWKSRWCVMRKLSPVADCLHIQLYRDSRSRYKRAPTKASLSLQHFLGIESGFTLDKEANTIAIICQDVVVLLAFDTRETLMQWQVKVSSHVAESRQYLVLVVGEGATPGPARLHVRGDRLAICTGSPPKLMATWELAHLRRYGVIDGKFCFEGGSCCGKGEGVHVLLTEKASDIARTIDVAAKGHLSGKDALLRNGRRSPPHHEGACEDAGFVDEAATSSYWDERQRDVGLGDALSVHEPASESALWDGSHDATLERCMSCMSKLGAMSRSSTAALTPGATHFSPAWTMDALNEHAPRPPPERPPKPIGQWMNDSKSPMTLPRQVCICNEVGPYENYDVPKCALTDVDSERYDTPKRLKQCLSDELLKTTNNYTLNALLSKNLEVDKKRSAEAPPPPCPCERVSAWFNLPYCRRSAASQLYATVDLARKTNRCGVTIAPPRSVHTGIDEGLSANYENLNFALSLEYYENAKHVLRRTGVTQGKTNSLNANMQPGSQLPCEKCGLFRVNHNQEPFGPTDDYLVMEPREVGVDQSSLLDGYTPMSPVTDFQMLKHPKPPLLGLIAERSASNPSLTFDRNEAPKTTPDPFATNASINLKRRKRSCSADSSRFLEDVKEFDSSVSASSSSLETLRNMPVENSSATNAAQIARVRRSASVPCRVKTNRDSSDSNDSGVSNCSRASGVATEPPRAPRPSRLSRSTDLLRQTTSTLHLVPGKSSIAAGSAVRGVLDSRSTSSGTSDMSDYIETLSLSSEHSSTETSSARNTMLLRPRSGSEYQLLLSRLFSLTRVPHRPLPLS